MAELPADFDLIVLGAGSFVNDDRAVVDDYRDGPLLLFIENWLPVPGQKRHILGGMVALARASWGRS